MDYIFGAVLLIFCFVSFRHADILVTIWASFGFYLTDWNNIYEYYLSFRGFIQPYNPSTYIVFAIWFLPHYLFGLISDPPVYPAQAIFWMWAKLLCVLVYCLSGWCLYRLALYISKDNTWSKYTAALWLTAPIALFSQFIFSGYDVFYVVLTIVGVHTFLQNRLWQASILFGIAITFKTFPAFVFLPLLFLYEKRLWRLIAHFAVFYGPSLLYRICYSGSQAYYDGVLSFSVLNKVFGPAIRVSEHAIITLPFVLALLSGIAYFTDITEENKVKSTLYVWLVGSIFPFFIIGWYPQWLMFMCPAMAVTTMLSRKQSAFLLLDIAGIFFLVAFIVSKFNNHVDGAIFVGAQQLLGYKSGIVPMYEFFIRSFMTRDMYYTCFQAYLVLVVALKFRELRLREPLGIIATYIDIRHLRLYFCVGILMFVVPACWSVYKTMEKVHLENAAQQQLFPPGPALSNRPLQQIFKPAQDMTIDKAELLLATYGRVNTCTVYLDILGPDGKSLARAIKPANEIKDNSWCQFTFDSVKLTAGTKYTLSLTSDSKEDSNAVTWWCSKVDSYPDGHVIYGGKQLPKNDALFKLIGEGKLSWPQVKTSIGL